MKPENSIPIWRMNKSEWVYVTEEVAQAHEEAFASIPTEPESDYIRIAKQLLRVEKLDEPPFLAATCDFTPSSNPGDLTDEQDEELAAVVCLHSHGGVTREQWVEMGEKKRLPWMKISLPIIDHKIESLPPKHSKVSYDEVPRDFREKRNPNDAVLTSKYLIESAGWEFKNSKQFTSAYTTRILTHRIKVGRTYAYLFLELLALQDAIIEKETSR